ncbi:hypothetical protein FACS189485_09870 [Spirochaetia bacterium]|nr:hypothetical protein FACS189485_09870 [Spirochaetia bacterium]
MDDNSDPAKVDFDNFPGLNDPHVEVVFSKEGRGGGYARNIGLSKAKGKWLIFSDADDYFSQNAFANFDKNNTSEMDILFFGIDIVDEDSIENNDYSFYLENRKDAIISYRANRRKRKIAAFYWEPWGKMFLADYIFQNNLRFSETPVMNDALFYVLAAEKTDKIDAFEDIVYFYILRNGSTVRTNDKQKEMAALQESVKVNKVLIRNGYFTDTRNINEQLKTMEEFGPDALVEAKAVYLKNRHRLDCALFHLLMKFPKMCIMVQNRIKRTGITLALRHYFGKYIGS